MRAMMDLGRALESQGPFDPQKLSKSAAFGTRRFHRQDHGFAETGRLLTWPSENEKLAKGGQLNYSLALAPADSSHVVNVCRYSTPGCRRACVAFSGNGKYPHVQRGRSWRAVFLAEQPEAFLRCLWEELDQLGDRHPKQQVAVRLNAFSDLRWERIAPSLFTDFPDIQFYDYSKWPHRYRRLDIANYHLTFSHTGERGEKVKVAAGTNTAVVFDTKRGLPLPETYQGYRVVDGDETDGRYDDGSGVIVGLRAKGRARNDTTGFVVRLNG